MQRRKLNVPLFLALIIGSLVFCGAAYGLHQWQMKENAAKLKEMADYQYDKGELRKAVNTFDTYTRLSGGAEEDMARLAIWYSELVDFPGLTPEKKRLEVGAALNIMESVARNHPDQIEARSRLVEVYMDKVGGFKQALAHLDFLIDQEPDNPKWKSEKCRALFVLQRGDEAVKLAYPLIGYDLETDQFDAEKATGADQVETYVLLAQHLRNRDKNPELADRVIMRMVEANPGSAEALTARAQYYYAFRTLYREGTEEDTQEALRRAKADVTEALAIDENGEDTLYLAARLAGIDEDFEAMRKHLTRGIEQHPKNIRMYELLARLEVFEPNDRTLSDKVDAAIAHLNKGLREVDENSRPYILFIKVGFQLDANRKEAAQKTIEEMKKIDIFTSNAAVLVDFLEARLQMLDSQWVPAARKLKNIRPQIENHQISLVRQRLSELDALLAGCYKRMGKTELAREAYISAYRLGSQSPSVLRAIQSMAVRRDAPKTGRTNGAEEPTQQEQSNAIAETLKQLKTIPPEDRDYTDVENYMDKVKEAKQLSPLDEAKMWAQVYLFIEDYPRASKVLTAELKKANAAYKEAKGKNPDAKPDPEVAALWYQFFTLKIMTEDYKTAQMTLDQIKKDYGDSVPLRSSKATLLVKREDENLRERLLELEKNLDQFDENEKSRFWRMMAGKYEQARLTKDTQRCMRKAVAATPGGLVERKLLFDLALNHRDYSGAKEALDQIEALVGKEDSVWQYCEAARIIQLVKERRMEPSSLKEAEDLIEKAKKLRPQWQDIYLLQADLQSITGRVAAAIVSYELALKYGPARKNMLTQLYSLYVSTGKYDKAKAIENQLGEENVDALPISQQVTTMLASGEVDKALAKAREFVDADEENGKKQLWIGGLYVRAKKYDEADQAFQRATELLPGEASAWLASVQMLAKRNKLGEADLQARKAQLSLPDERLPVFLAQCSEILDRKVEAETYYLMALQNDPKNMSYLRAAARYYLSPNYYRSDGRAKASVYLKQMLQQADQVREDDPSLSWARQTTARMLATRKRYDDVLKALELLDANRIDGKSLLRDDLLKAEILSRQRDVQSRQKAIALYEKIDRQGNLGVAQQLTLAKLYNERGQWDKCRPRLYRLLEQFPDNQELLTTLAAFHLEHKELNEAGKVLDKLASIAPNHLLTLQLQAQWHAKLGQDGKAIATLEKLLPAGTAEEKDLPTLRIVAAMMESLDQQQKAEQYYLRCARLDRDETKRLVSFYGRQHRVEEAFAELDKMVDQGNLEEAARGGVNVVGLNREEIGDKFDERVRKWIDRFLTENPNSAPMLYVLASFQEVQKKYAEVEDTYEKLLAHPDVKGGFRAICLNNLAFLLATRDKELPRALEYVNQAIGELGPNPDLLDTRALVYLNMGDTKKAIEELAVSIQDKPEALVYFHMAAAQLEGGDRAEAKKAWIKAHSLGLKRANIRHLEQKMYEKLKEEFGDSSLRSAA